MQNIPGWSVIDLYCILELLFLLAADIRQNREKYVSTRVFRVLLVLTVFTLVMDWLSRLYQTMPQNDFYWVQIGTFCKYVMFPILAQVYFVYVSRLIFRKHRPRYIRVWMGVMTAMNVVILAAVSISLHTGWTFYFDETGYHRGPAYMEFMALSFVMILGTELVIICSRKYMEQKQYLTLCFFLAPAVAGGVLQAFLYGLPFTLIGISYSMLTVFINVQNHNKEMDYLTGVYNRRKLDEYLTERIENASAGNTFAGIMIDLDEFKKINDHYGHDAGDQALKGAVYVMRQGLHGSDFIGRFGGDEFLVILNHADEHRLQEYVAKLYAELTAYNRTSRLQDELGLSIGSRLYDPQQPLTARAFMQAIDLKMYENKRKKNLPDRRMPEVMTGRKAAENEEPSENVESK